MRSKKFRLFLFSAAFVIIIALIVFLVLFTINYNSTKDKERVLGIDVSAYQGEIDWREIESQGISFAYIKATEGDDYVDSRFEDNWKNIDETNIRKGAYLFYNFNDNAEKSADHFIDTVKKDRKALPPVIDIELTGNEEKLPEKNTVVKNTETLISKLKEYYKVDPIIYTNNHTYETYFMDGFKDIKFWIADISGEDPKLKNHEWLFWQYTWRNMLNGINGSSIFVDGDVFNGNIDDFKDTFKTGWF